MGCIAQVIRLSCLFIMVAMRASGGEAAEQPYVPLTPAEPETEAPNAHRYTLVEYFTADTLEPGEFKLGFELEYAPIGGLMFGTDLLALAVGAPTIQGKALIWHDQQNRISFGLLGAYYNKSTALWGLYEDHFEKLDAKIIRPSVSWTHELSPRLNLHTYWSIGFGETNASLTEKGQRALWESKNPNGDWATRETEAPEDDIDGDGDEDVNTTSNQEARSHRNSLSNRTLQLQTLTGILNDVFQITGEYKREGSKKVLITSRIEQSELEDLKSNSFRFTVAQQWIFDVFQFRLGIGLQYQVLSGTDLDGEIVDDTGVYPATDLDFYWRF